MNPDMLPPDESLTSDEHQKALAALERKFITHAQADGVEVELSPDQEERYEDIQRVKAARNRHERRAAVAILKKHERARSR